MQFDVEVHGLPTGVFARTVEPPRERGRLVEWTADKVWMFLEAVLGGSVKVHAWEVHGGDGRWVRRGRPGEHGLVLDGAKVVYFVKQISYTDDDSTNCERERKLRPWRTTREGSTSATSRTARTTAPSGTTSRLSASRRGR